MGDLRVVAVDAPVEGEIERECVVSRFADRERADAKRTFRVLHQGELTQLVGIVEPCRAPDQQLHPYDEVGYIVKGHQRRAHRRRAGAAAGRADPTCRPAACTASRTRGRA